jgi:hypothetical protein
MAMLRQQRRPSSVSRIDYRLQPADLQCFTGLFTIYSLCIADVLEGQQTLHAKEWSLIMTRWWLVALFFIPLVCTTSGARNHRQQAVWQLDARQYGYRLPTYETLNCSPDPFWHCETLKTSKGLSDYAQIGFLDDNTLAIFFNTAMTPNPLRSLFLDSRTGTVLGTAYWEVESMGSYFHPTLGGRFLWHMSKREGLEWRERLALYTPDLKIAKERNTESHSLTLSHTRKTMLLVNKSQSRTVWRNEIGIVDAVSLDTINSLSDAEGDNLTVYDNYNSLFAKTTHPLRGGGSEISIQTLGEASHVVYASADRNCSPREAYFLTSNVLFVNQKWDYWECPVWLLMTASGEVVHAEKMDKYEDTTPPTPSQTSYDGKRFTLLLTKRKAGLFEERALAHRVAQRVIVFNADTKRQIFEYQIKPLREQLPVIALSPSGNRLAVFESGRLQVFVIE